jgi:hypothetical protein
VRTCTTVRRSSRGRTTRRPNRSALGRTTPSAVRGPSPAHSPRSHEELEGSGQLGGGSGNGSNHGTVRRLEPTWQGPEPRPSCRSTHGAAYIPDVSLWPLPTGPTGQPTCLLGVLLRRTPRLAPLTRTHPAHRAPGHLVRRAARPTPLEDREVDRLAVRLPPSHCPLLIRNGRCSGSLISA